MELPSHSPSRRTGSPLIVVVMVMFILFCSILKRYLTLQGWIVLCFLLFVNAPPVRCSASFSQLTPLLGNSDAVVIENQQGKILFSINAEKKLIPASTLKILTSLAALHFLGEDYRFVTEFYMDQESNLRIKGYGDPLLISETVSTIASTLRPYIENHQIWKGRLNNLLLDDSYFNIPITVPGRRFSLEPYDAPNSALCVNFNTVYFKSMKNGAYVSAEPQTPLIPFVQNRIKESKKTSGRILLSGDGDEATLYAGHMFKHFLQKEGLEFQGAVEISRAQNQEDLLVYRYVSVFSLKEVISRLLEFSNNFIANQILLASGAKAFGPPASLAKGVRAVSKYARQELGINGLYIVEGSGISRQNRMSAADLGKALKRFEPHRRLMRKDGSRYYKTGTLNGIRTQAGYIENRQGELYRFVLLLNTPGKSAEKIVEMIIDGLNEQQEKF